ncbi:MAG: POTRA domain-containing protein, partial [Polyangia bacterium]
MMMTVGATGSGCAHPGEHGQPVVRKLSFTGTRQVSAGSLSAGIATTATGWWWPFATEHYYDPFTWQTDLRRIERIYQSRGFFAARVVSDTVKPVKDGVALSVVVQEGLPTLVSSFTVQGLDTLDQQQRAGILRGIAFSGPFVEAKWQAAKATLGERLRNLGYARAAVEGRALLDPGTRRADLLLVVQLGTRYRFGAIQI